MATPTISILVLAPQAAGWDAICDANFTAIKNALTGQPICLVQYNAATALPAAGSYDRGIAAKSDAGAWHLYFSNGTTWEQIVTANTPATDSVRGSVLQATASSDIAQTVSDPPTQAEVNVIQSKVNVILARLRTAGVIAT